MWVAALLSAQPEVDDFDGLFAVIVGEREKESGFFLWLPMRKLALFRATLLFLFLLTCSLSSYLTRVARFLLYLIRLPNLRVN